MFELFNYRDYERLKKASTQHVLDQMYESLKQFDAFNSVPPSTLEKLFPFSPTRLQLAKVKDYHREPTDARHETGSHLQTSNEKIIALMQSIEFKEGKILLKENSPEAETVKHIPHFEKKLAYVFDKLRSSQIHCIQRIDDNSNDNHNRINYVTTFSKDLSFVQWLDFHYKPLLEAVHSQRLTATGSSAPPLRERLLDGLVLSQLHYYLEAYEVYSDIGKDALKNQDFATFFICQHNKLFVGRMVGRSANFSNYPQDLVERIEDEINVIDLAAYLRVMQLEKEVKGLLTDVFQKDFFEKYGDGIKESHKKVLKNYEFFKSLNSHMFWDSYEGHYLIEWYSILYWFYFSNGILLGWDRSKFAELTELTFEGQIASLCTSERDNGRLKTVNIELLRMACHFLETKKLGEILDRYKFEEFPFASIEEKKWCVQLAINWYSSLFDESQFFFSINKNRHLSRYFQEKEYFGEVDYLSNNFLLIFSHIDLEELQGSSELTHLIDAILKALLHFLGEKSLWDEKYLIKFLYRNLKYFSQKQIEMVLVATAKSRGWTHRIGVYLARFLEKNKIEFQLADSQVLHELIYPKREGCAQQNKVHDFVFLYPYLSSDLQKELETAVREKLSIANPRSVLLWFQAKCEGTLPPEEEMPDNLHEVFEKQFARISAIQFQPDGEVILRHSTYDVNIPYWCGALVYSDGKGLGTGTTKRLLANSNLPGVFRWLLDPKGFDYKTFNCYWVFFFGEAEVLTKVGMMKIPALRKAFEKELKKEFSVKLAKVYFTYLLAG